MKFRLRYEVLGGHTHVRLFAGKGASTPPLNSEQLEERAFFDDPTTSGHGETLALCGTLVFRNEEWEEFLKQTGRTNIEVLPEDIPV